ncbi:MULTISPECIES: helix-turn-helix transcriptional regulator [Bacillus]|uniref:helix-turn-helix domain-containing protein n=1 Tax=Bacillus TaxID=1386 RepID=UPI0027DBFA90|nr:helix-turn-helix transcriptional regulator [Bacillus thuringiensis]
MIRFKIKETRRNFVDILQSFDPKINYDYSNLSKVERGVYTPSLELLNKISQVYNLEISDLIVPINSVNKKVIDILDINGSQLHKVMLKDEGISKEESEFPVQNFMIMRKTIKNTNNI